MSEEITFKGAEFYKVREDDNGAYIVSPEYEIFVPWAEYANSADAKITVINSELLNREERGGDE